MTIITRPLAGGSLYRLESQPDGGVQIYVSENDGTHDAVIILSRSQAEQLREDLGEVGR